MEAALALRAMKMATPVADGNEVEESRWIARAATGEESAFRWLLSRYRTAVVRLASHILGRPDEAEDVAQETFIRAFRGLRSFRGDSRFTTWLFHIAVRVCSERRRRKWWDTEAPLDDAEPAPSGADAADTRLLVASLLNRISPASRAVLVLREVDGLEYEEIARVMNVPVGTVRSRLHAARGRFRQMWTDALREAEDA
jgi:RNA polymerase sigma-70 factor (ECF subfamily)